MSAQKLKQLLDTFTLPNANNNYWYDVGFEEAQTILRHFKDQDWFALKEISMCKS